MDAFGCKKWRFHVRHCGYYCLLGTLATVVISLLHLTRQYQTFQYDETAEIISLARSDNRWTFRLDDDLTPNVTRTRHSIHAKRYCDLMNMTMTDSEQFECVNTRTAPPAAVVCIFGRLSDVFISHDLRETGVWEPHLAKSFLEFLDLNPALGVIDIGANVGFYTMLAAARGRHVVAIEPSESCSRRLRKAVQLMHREDRVVVVSNAVADRRVKATVRPSGDNQGDTRIELETHPCLGSCPSVTSTILMDDLVEVVGFREAIMKIDVQGFEHLAFVHANILLDTVRVLYIFMEWMVMREYFSEQQNVSRDKALVNDMIKMLWIRRYRPYGSSKEYEVALDPYDWGKWPDDIIWHLMPNDLERSKLTQTHFLNWLN